MPGLLTVYLGAYKGWEMTASIVLGSVLELQATASNGEKLFAGPGLLDNLLNAIDELESTQEENT